MNTQVQSSEERLRSRQNVGTTRKENGFKAINCPRTCGGKYKETPDQVPETEKEKSAKRWKYTSQGGRRKTKMPQKPSKESFRKEKRSKVTERTEI